MLSLFCARPHVRTVDPRTARFVVGKVCGLDVNGRHLEMGEEVPRGVLSDEAIRQIYDTPLRRIETIEFAFQDEALRAECLRHGVQIEKPRAEEPAPAPARPDLDELDFPELVRLCKKYHLSHVGNTRQLRQRLSAVLGR